MRTHPEDAGLTCDGELGGRRRQRRAELVGVGGDTGGATEEHARRRRRRRGHVYDEVDRRGECTAVLLVQFGQGAADLSPVGTQREGEEWTSEAVVRAGKGHTEFSPSGKRNATNRPSRCDHLRGRIPSEGLAPPAVHDHREQLRALVTEARSDDLCHRAPRQTRDLRGMLRIQR